MKCLVIGARALNPIGSSRIQKHASLRLVAGGNCLQIDCGNPFSGQCQHILISHMHGDHMGKVASIPATSAIYAPHHSFLEQLRKASKAQVRLIRAQRASQLKSFVVTPFLVQHSKHTKAYGFRITYKRRAIAWLSDYHSLRGATRYLRALDVLFIGASTYKRDITREGKYGHMAIDRALAVLQQQGIRPKRIVLMHIGRRIMPIETTLASLQAQFPGFAITVAHDGMRINV